MDTIRDYRKLPAAQQTLQRLKTDMREANNERIRLATTAGETGFNANKAETDKENSPPSDTSSQPETKKAPRMPNYCWSCGLTWSNHTSKNCKSRKPGHKENATLGNMKGGNNLMPRRWGEKPHQQFEHLKLE